MLKQLHRHSGAIWTIVLTLSLTTGLFLMSCSDSDETQSPQAETESPMDSNEPTASSDGVVVDGSQVQVQYTGKLSDGTIFDQSQEGSPLGFTVGAGQMIPGFEKAVLGMALDEEKEVTIPSAEAYGERNEAMIRDFERSQFPEDMTPEVGQVIGLQTESGQQVPGTITVVGDEKVTIDLNHQLAGKDLTFLLKVVAIN